MPLARIVKRRKPRRGVVKDREYLAWIRDQPCALSSPLILHCYAIEAAHVGDRGLGQKCSDRETIPLCQWHHRIGTKSHHALGKRFWVAWDLDRDMLIQQYNAAYEAQR